MTRENSNKVKLLKLMEILTRETDETHPIRRRDLLARLLAEGFTCDIRTLSKDIATLNEFGYEVMAEKRNNEKLYYVSERRFSIPELKILIDAVQAASFITKSKSEELIKKLASLGGSCRGEILKQNIVAFHTRKHTNESIFYSIDTLEKAITENRKVIFRYFDIDENGYPVYRRDGHHYVAEPVALVFHEDNYYLISYSDRYNGTTNYRVDRMHAVEIIPVAISEQAIALRGNVCDLTDTAFKMYAGRTEEVTLAFDRDLLGVVYDKFGEDTKVTCLDEAQLSVTVPVQISPTFYSWLFQFGAKMRIMEPEDVRAGYEERMRGAKTASNGSRNANEAENDAALGDTSYG